jgi:hypothetical protein
MDLVVSREWETKVDEDVKNDREIFKEKSRKYK